MNKFAKHAVLVSALALSFSAAAAFQSGMTMSQVESEIQQRANNRESLAAIIAAATPVPTAILSCAAISQGFEPGSVLSAMMAVGRPAGDVVAAAMNCGAREAQLAPALVAAGLDPAAYFSGTAGGETGPSSFSGSPSSTAGGGGGRSASPS